MNWYGKGEREMSSYYRDDVCCHWCGATNKGCRRYGFQWVCVDCEERDVAGKLLPYDERWSDRALYNRQYGGCK